MKYIKYYEYFNLKREIRKSLQKYFFNKCVDIIENVENINDSKSIKIKEEKKFDDIRFYFDIDINFKKSDNYSVKVGGQILPKTTNFMIFVSVITFSIPIEEIKLNPLNIKKIYEELSYKISELVDHEMSHFQKYFTDEIIDMVKSDYNDKLSKRYNITYNNKHLYNIMIKEKNGLLNKIITPDEILAYLRGINKMAKRQKSDFKTLLDEKLNFFEDVLTGKTKHSPTNLLEEFNISIDDIRNLYYDNVKNLFPNIKL